MNRRIHPSLLGALVTAATMAHADTASYAIDPNHTFVTFEIQHVGTSTQRGRFDRKAGTIQLDRAAKTGMVDVTIDSNFFTSLQVG